MSPPLPASTPFADILQWRGAEGLPLDRPWLIKAGFDPTSADLHLGHAVLLRALRQWQDQGHRVVMVVGDFTATIGDPTGRNTTRPVLTREQVLANAKTYLDQALVILDPQRTEVRFNSEWFASMSASDLLGLMQAATVAQMLARNDFAERIERREAVGLHELVYPLLQGHDSVMLRCDLEVGGTDQLFNLMAGRAQQQAAGQAPQAVAMVPLLVGLDGTRKMSKSYGNHIALREPPTEVFGKTMRIVDALVPQWAALLAVPGMLPSEGPSDPYQAKRDLARGLVCMLHGPQAAQAADDDWSRRFSQRAIPDQVAERSAAPGATLIQILVEWGFAPSMTVARQKVREGAVRLDGQKVFNPDLVPVEGLLQLGTRQQARLVGEGALPQPSRTPRQPR